MLQALRSGAKFGALSGLGCGIAAALLGGKTYCNVTLIDPKVTIVRAALIGGMGMFGTFATMAIVIKTQIAANKYLSPRGRQALDVVGTYVGYFGPFVGVMYCTNTSFTTSISLIFISILSAGLSK